MRKVLSLLFTALIVASAFTVLALASSDERHIYDSSMHFTTDVTVGDGTYDKKYAGFKYIGSSTPYYMGGNFKIYVERNEPFLLFPCWKTMQTYTCRLHDSTNFNSIWYCGNHEVDSNYQQYRFRARSNVIETTDNGSDLLHPVDINRMITLTWNPDPS